ARSSRRRTSRRSRARRRSGREARPAARPESDRPAPRGAPGSPHLGEELAPQVGVLVVEAAPEGRDRARALLLDTTHLRAQMGGLDPHRDATRADELDESVRDLLAEALLHREPPRVQTYEARQLRVDEDLVGCDIPDV